MEGVAKSPAPISRFPTPARLAYDSSATHAGTGRTLKQYFLVQVATLTAEVL